MNNNPFLETMQAHPDKKLKEIVESKRGDYQPDAIAAAEEILRKRKVKFAEAEPEVVEHVEMTYEEIANDVWKRRNNGQSMSSIKAYYKECGVDIDMEVIQSAIAESKTDSKPKWSLGKVRSIAFLAGIGIAIMVKLDWNSPSVKAVAPWIIGIGAAVGLYFLVRKK